MRILIVEDEVRLAEALAQIMAEQKYQVDQVHNGANGLDYALTAQYDVIVLEVMLPKLDEISDKVKGLDCGADDYMIKPFDTSELLARVRALTRRQGEVVSEELVFGDLSLHLSSHCLRRGDRSVRLGFKEFEVLRLLLQNAQLVTPRDDIIAKVWGLDSEAEDNNVEVYISFLRKKLSFLASQVSIGTVRKVGYFLTTSDEPGSFGGGGMP